MGKETDATKQLREEMESLKKGAATFQGEVQRLQQENDRLSRENEEGKDLQARLEVAQLSKKAKQGEVTKEHGHFVAVQ